MFTQLQSAAVLCTLLDVIEEFCHSREFQFYVPQRIRNHDCRACDVGRMSTTVMILRPSMTITVPDQLFFFEHALLMARLEAENLQIGSLLSHGSQNLVGNVLHQYLIQSHVTHVSG